ncbi:MAG: BadF/BadG/BcrA/BcrD ATPase family protein [Tabrizicola sp.]|uniref:BadF/BadG/BcrA/BcrD ATPase family protein n=1 Tax=Tabrizicola sp. TaxID=2005166 RepID=UPI00273507EA|nr:BadF/BadG/BcrA/BcrD ATPase family protein [Tabrizicola sp.]MDP3262135.1 BadF/BadG/BcrA/BcrD ATPase family protein [Tabrizicola sp.]MDP3648119.1 BadF/BadG/BcrA/BcrD ATPase family protein [Paracoccaceae bacterium]
MTLFLGIDGGGTGCRAAVADAAGRILGEGSAGPANIASDPEGARLNILAATREALSAAVGSSSAGAEEARLAAGLGLAGANAAGAAGRLKLALPFARTRVETDAVAAVKGALRQGDGIVAALGTGSVFARQKARQIRQIGGWGLALGDEGSGAWLGRRVLARALRAVDGFEPMTPFLQALIDAHGGPEGVVGFSLAARPADFAVLAPRILASTDRAATGVVKAAVADVAAAIDLLQADGPVPVVFIGGLGAIYAARLSGRWQVMPALGSALDGALILAREAA